MFPTAAGADGIFECQSLLLNVDDACETQWHGIGFLYGIGHRNGR